MARTAFEGSAALLIVFAFTIPQAPGALVGYWSLDGDTDADAGGWGPSTLQSGGNGENDVTFVADVPTQIGSRNTQSIAFDGNNDDHIATAFNAGTAGIDGPGEVTVSYWLKHTGAPNNNAVVYLGNASQSGGQLISFEPTSNGRLAAYYFNGNRISSNNALQQGPWQHVALTYETDHGTSRVFIDGVDVSGSVANATNTVSFPADATITLGDRVQGVDPSNDLQLADLSIWDSVLSDAHIAQLAAGASPVGGPPPPAPETILSTDFAGRSVSGKTANNITWTTNGVQDPGSLTFVPEGGAPTNTNLFDTPNAQGHFAPDINVENEGPWSVDIPIDVTALGVEIQDVVLDWQHFNNNGAFQGANRSVDWTATMTGSVSGEIGTKTANVSGTSGIVTITFDTPLSLTGSETWVLNLHAVGSGPGNNTGLDGINVVGLVSTVIPEPSTLAIWGLGLLSLIGWRRRRTK